jgi:hypothetical protein
MAQDNTQPCSHIESHLICDLNRRAHIARQAAQHAVTISSIQSCHALVRNAILRSFLFALEK